LKAIGPYFRKKKDLLVEGNEENLKKKEKVG
jgi:hypothetical protein